VFSETGPRAIGASARKTAVPTMRRLPAPSRTSTNVTQKIAARQHRVISTLKIAS